LLQKYYRNITKIRHFFISEKNEEIYDIMKKTKGGKIMGKKIMTLKCLLITICVILLVIIPTVVNAYSGEIDPEDYITLPERLSGVDGIRSGNVRLNSGAGSNYSLYYQAIFLTANEFNQILTKLQETNEIIEALNTEYDVLLSEKQLEVEQKEEEYNNIKDDTTKTEEEIETALNAYEKARTEFQELYDEYYEKVNTTQQNFYSSLPNFSDSNWKQTTDNTVEIDVSQYNGDIYFVLWAKLTNSTGTYYDYGLYSTTVTEQTTLSLDKTTAEIEVGDTVQLTATTNSEETVTWTSDKEKIATVNSSGLVTGVAEGIATITAEVEGETATCVVTVKAKQQTGDTEKEDDDSDSLTWTDFSKAKVRLETENYGTSLQKVILVMDGVDVIGETANEIAQRYQIYVSNNATDIPELTSYEKWDYTNNGQYTDSTEDIRYNIDKDKYQLGGEYLYVWVREQQRIDGKVQYKMQVNAVKIERVKQWPLGTRFSAYFFNDRTSFYLWDYYNLDLEGSVKYKIGKVTDTKILKSIKNSEANCLEKLMEYAKNSESIYSGTAPISASDEIISKVNLIDKEYYYVYIELDTENGKYYPIEDVSLYQAQVTDDVSLNMLYNYLDDEFVWNLNDEEATSTPKEPEDDTISTEKLPNTGKTIITAIAIGSIIVVGIVSYKKYRNLKGI